MDKKTIKHAFYHYIYRPMGKFRRGWKYLGKICRRTGGRRDV